MKVSGKINNKLSGELNIKLSVKDAFLLTCLIGNTSDDWLGSLYTELETLFDDYPILKKYRKTIINNKGAITINEEQWDKIKDLFED